MKFSESIHWSNARVHAALLHSLESVTPEQVAWRACDNCNSIGSTVIHMGRVQDTWGTRIGGGADLWESEGWADRFGLPVKDRGWSYDQQSMEEKRLLKELLEYYEATSRRWAQILTDLPRERFVEPVESPLNLSVEHTFAHVVTELSQHLGQIDYLRGMQQSNA
jgi:uncharacterized damage-inducible protein DinB